MPELSFFDSLEGSFIGTWVRESDWGFPISLIVHAWGMAFLVGISLLFALSVLGVTPRLLPALLKYNKTMIWSGFVVCLASGLLLITAYPEQPLTSPVFFSKMLLIGLALFLLTSVQQRCLDQADTGTGLIQGPVKLKAVGILVCWFATITVGKLLYYTYPAF